MQYKLNLHLHAIESIQFQKNLIYISKFFLDTNNLYITNYLNNNI